MRQTWEYSVRRMLTDSVIVLGGRLAECGRDGWELVSVVEFNAMQSTFYFKRPVAVVDFEGQALAVGMDALAEAMQPTNGTEVPRAEE